MSKDKLISERGDISPSTTHTLESSLFRTRNRGARISKRLNRQKTKIQTPNITKRPPNTRKTTKTQGSTHQNIPPCEDSQGAPIKNNHKENSKIQTPDMEKTLSAQAISPKIPKTAVSWKTGWYLKLPTVPFFFRTRHRYARIRKRLSRQKTKNPDTEYHEKAPEHKKKPQKPKGRFIKAKDHGARLLKTITKKNSKIKHQIWKNTLSAHQPQNS